MEQIKAKQLTNDVHQIRIDFEVTKEVKRYVYVYLITGTYCYLIDSGVKGAEYCISNYMQQIGRSLSEVKGIFLTHAHPDHIGAAAEIKHLTGATIYASGKSVPWIQDIDLQFKERPIPNFYNLIGDSVHVDHPLQGTENIILEPGLSIAVVPTPGHSPDSCSYILNEECIFVGDAIPAPHDLPIFTDYSCSMETLTLLENYKQYQYTCPAWDREYEGSELQQKINDGRELLNSIYTMANQLYEANHNESKKNLVSQISKELGMNQFSQNPLFRQSILACLR